MSLEGGRFCFWKRESEEEGEEVKRVKRILSIFMVCIFMVTVVAFMAAPAFAACCVERHSPPGNPDHFVPGGGQGLNETCVHKNHPEREMNNC